MTTALRQRPDAELLADMREVAEVMRGLAGTAGLPDDDPRRQAWTARKRQLLERVDA